jgi:hypothetical protein
MSRDLTDIVVAGLAGLVAVAGVVWLSIYTTRLEQQLWKKGYRSPLLHASMVLVRLLIMFAGFAVAFVRAEDCSLCRLANVRDSLSARIYLKTASAVVEGAFAVAACMAVLATFVRWIPARVRRPGLKRTRVPWRVLSYLSLLAIVAYAWLWVAAGCELKHLGSFGQLLPLSVSAFLVCQNMAMRQARTRQQPRAADAGHPVLYLRAFASEGDAFADIRFKDRRRLGIQLLNSAPSRFGLTFEEYMTKAISTTLGPFEALGDPYDYLPPLGAARAYVSDDSWRDYFKQESGRAAQILVVPGPSNNLAWELAWIRSQRMHDKLFVLTHHGSVAARFRQYWDAFAVALASADFTPGSYPGPGAVVGFDGNGVARTLGRDARTPDDYVSVIAAASSSTRVA